MLNSEITRGCLERGEIKKGEIFIYNNQNGFIYSFKVKVLGWHKDGKNIVVKLQTYKDYPFGHKVIYRSLTELA